MQNGLRTCKIICRILHKWKPTENPFPSDNVKKYKMKTIPKTTTKIKEHCDKQIKENCGPGKYSSIFNHFIECNCYQYYLDLHNFPHDDVTLNNQDISEHIKNVATNNVKIIGKTENRTEISLLGSLNIK